MGAEGDVQMFREGCHHLSLRVRMQKAMFGKGLEHLLKQAPGRVVSKQSPKNRTRGPCWSLHPGDVLSLSDSRPQISRF